MIRPIAILLLGLLAYASPGSAAPARSSSSQTWLVVSDIHLNPFDRSSDPALVGSDSNLALLDQAVEQMKRFVPDPSVVLLPGDFLAHGFPVKAHAAAPTTPVAETALRTMQRIATALARTYPRAQFALTLGNNDASCGDYRVDVENRYAAALARIWEPLVNRNGAAPGFVRAFSHGGYYSVTLPFQGLRLVVLNTVPMSSEYRGSCSGGEPNVARDEIEWLRTTLPATPAGARNVVLMHIPPGYDPVSTQFAHGFVAWSFLNGRANDALIAALEDPRSRVSYAIAGHMHHFDFRLAGNVPILLFGSLSPVYRNNPAFYALRVGSDGGIRDIDAYVYDEWSGDWADGPHGFDHQWNVAGIDDRSLASLHQRLENDPALRKQWANASDGYPSDPGETWDVWTGRWRIPWCAQSVLESGYVQCADLGTRVTLFRVALALIVLAIAGTILSIVWHVRSARARVVNR